MAKSLEGFKPTWLYIKQHNITGLKYFGKTVRHDPAKYPGSGVYWSRHLAKHGNNVTTLWCQLFTDKEQLVDYAMAFSIANQIIESVEWANLIDESGLDGFSVGRIISAEIRAKIGAAHKGKTISVEQRKYLSELNTGKSWSEATKNKLSETLVADYASGKRTPARGMLGKRLTPEQKEKIRLALTNRPKSESHKEKMRQVNKGRSWILVDGKRVWVDK
jgi:hypothetical protein